MCISSVFTVHMYVTLSAKWRLQAGQLGLDSQHWGYGNFIASTDGIVQLQCTSIMQYCCPRQLALSLLGLTFRISSFCLDCAFMCVFLYDSPNKLQLFTRRH